MSDTSIELYDGRAYIGRVRERDGGKRCEAYDADGKALGIFVSRDKATAAIAEAAREKQREAAA